MGQTSGEILLSGIVGSTAYGLNNPDSDVDRMGIYAMPSIQLFGLHTPLMRELTWVTKDPDQVFHEAMKFCHLTLKCNPSVTELIWLPKDLYETITPFGEALIDIRHSFLSAHLVRSAYLGYATGQFQRLLSRGDGSFSSDTRKRTAKHARHLLRLLDQGVALYRSGVLEVRVANPDWYFNWGEEIAKEPDHARRFLADAEHSFDMMRTVLPDKPDEATVAAWLLEVRRAYLSF